MAEDDEVQRYFGGLSFNFRRELATKIKEEADGLADAIKAEAPVLTGTLRDSVKVRRKRNELDLEITAGGDSTTRMYDRSTGYESAVVIDGRSNKGIDRKRGARASDTITRSHRNTAQSTDPRNLFSTTPPAGSCRKSNRTSSRPSKTCLRRRRIRMSAPGTVSLAWSNGENEFCLAKIGLMLALEEKAGAPIAQVFVRLLHDKWGIQDVRERRSAWA